ncbi:MAG: DEAD/DEAH box helicase [Rhizomicrobium sp.]
MAFKSNTFANTAAADPAAHFKTLTKRQYPDVMPHQKEMLEMYAAHHMDAPDIALQLPTGSGKTLVGLLVADWRRKKLGDRAVYLCPTRQLVHQTVSQARNQYGIDAIDLSGPKNSFPPADRTAYKTGMQVAVSTYSGLFNTHPFFDDCNLIIVDDAHVAENYIANMWSVQIEADTPLHDALAEFLRPHLDPQEYSRLTGDWNGSTDATWVEKMPASQALKLGPEIADIIDSFATNDNPRLYFPWSLLRDHLEACHIYLASREILIRPLIPPTSTHMPFINAAQRIFMSATLGNGGDLERLTGRKKIVRLPASDDFQSAGVGRRFFIFPSLSLTGEETDALRLSMQKRAGRSVILTTSDSMADAHQEQVEDKLDDFAVFTAEDIEEDKTPFVSTKNAVAILANRYDGIDFPGDECRLLCVDGMPKAMNAQERFIMSKMGAAILYNERIQTRVLQAMGRCTRALQDRSAVFVTGTSLVDFLADNRNWSHFPPELQAELSFGVDQSRDVGAAAIFDNFNMFLLNNAGWVSADAMIRSAVPNFKQTAFPAMEELEATVEHEIAYQEAMWHKDFAGALAAAKDVLSHLQHAGLRGYRALWHYLAGAAALRLSEVPNDQYAVAAREQFRRAKAAAPAVSWLNALARAGGAAAESEKEGSDAEVLKQVEALEQEFLAMGTATNAKFEKRAAEIQNGLAKPNTFESAQVMLGTLLGFSASNDETDAAPDPWWLGARRGIVFETNADAKDQSIFGATKARQVSGHPKWIKKNVPGAEAMEVVPILVTPCSKAKTGAEPHLDSVRYWLLADFRAWATHAIAVLRSLKGTFQGEGDLVWRAEAAQRLDAEGLTLRTIIENLPLADKAMEIVA